jgi:chitodextrinase
MASTDKSGVTGYLVERCQGAGCANFAQISTPTVPSFGDSGLTASTSYTYRVRATDAAGNFSAYSNTATATTLSAPDTTPPTAPSNLTATSASSSQIDLSWTASTDNVGVTGYLVERCQGAACNDFTQVATPTATAFNDTDLTASTSYSYRARATDAAGNLSTYSNVASATTLASGSTPAQTPTPFGFSSQMSTTLAQGSTGNGNPTTGCWDTGSVGLNPYYFCLPDTSIAGNTIVAACEWGSTSGLGTPTLVDDRSQTYTSQMQQIRSGGYSVQAWIFSNTVANVHQLKLSWSGAPPSGNMKCNAFQVANVAPSSPSCGTAVGANYTSGTAVSAGSIAASQSGCLFVQVGSEDGGALATWASGSSWTLQDADPRVGFAIQTIVAGSGSTPCSMSISTGSSGATLCFALLPSSAAQGSVPTGMYVSHMQLAPAFDGVSSYTYQFPGSGNLCVMTSSSNTTDALPSSVTSTNPTATWTKVGATVMGGEGNETVWYAGDNVGCTPTTTITVRFTSASTNTDDLYFLDLAGAATSSVLDTCTGGGGASCANSLWSNSGNQGDFSNPVTIGTFTPGSSGGMIIVTGGIADNGSTSFSPTGYQDDQDNNDLHAHYKYTSNATQTFAISADERQAAGGIGPWSVAAVAFVAAPLSSSTSPASPLQFTATVTGDSQNLGVTWSVDGTNGGNSSSGTTSVSRLFTPSTIPGSHTIAATSVANSTVSPSSSIAPISPCPMARNTTSPLSPRKAISSTPSTPTSAPARSFGNLPCSLPANSPSLIPTLAKPATLSLKPASLPLPSSILPPTLSTSAPNPSTLTAIITIAFTP